MSGIRSENKLLSGRALREMNLNQFSTAKQVLNGEFSMQKELEHYLEQNHQLRIKCRKIDQIQKYASILVENADQLKKNNEELENKLSSFHKQNERMKQQLKHANLKQGFLQQNSIKFNQKHVLKKMNEVEDNFQLIRMKQEMVSIKHNHQRILNNIQQKHRTQISKLQQQIKIGQSQALQTNNFLKSQNQIVQRQNQQLRIKLLEDEELSKDYKQQIEKLNGQLRRYESLCQDYEDKMQNQYLIISKLQSQTRQSVSTIRRENQQLIMAISKLEESNGMLEKIHVQLKNQGANIILESDSLRKKILELEQQIIMNVKVIDKLNSEMQMLKNIHKLQLQKEHQAKMSLQQLMNMLQKDNVCLKRQKDDLSKQILTKQQQIQDLIAITSKLEQKIQIMSQTTLSLQEQNNKQNKQIQELLCNSDFQRIQIDKCKTQIKLIQNLRNQLQQSYNQLTISFNTTVQNLQQQKTRLINLQGDLQTTQTIVRDLQLENQRIRSESNDKQHQSQHLQSEKYQYQRLYNQEKQQKQMCKTHIQSLVKQVQQFQRLLKDLQNYYEGQTKKIKQEQKYSMQNEMRKEIQQIQQAMNQKYSQMLNEYRDCFHQKIEVLQKEIQLINLSQISERRQND